MREISEVATLFSFLILFSEVVCDPRVASGPPTGLSLEVSCRILYASQSFIIFLGSV